MTQKLFPDFGSEGLREARVVYLAGENTGEGRRMDVEKRGPRFEEVKAILHEAALKLKDPKVNAMLADEETAQMIASQVEMIAGDKSKKWLNAIALSFLQKSGDIFTGEGQALDAAKDKSTSLAKECARILQTTIDELKAQEKAYRDAGGTGDYPGYDAALKTVLAKKTNIDTFKNRFDQLVGLMKNVLWAADDDLKDTKKWTDRFKTAGIPETGLTAFVAATEPSARRAALLKIIRETGGIELLSDDERKKVGAAIQAIETGLYSVNWKVEDHIQTRFAARVRYLDRLGGSDAGALIALSINDDGMLATDFLQKRCSIILKRADNQLTADEQNKLKAAINLSGPEVKKADSAEMKNLEKKYPGVGAKLKDLLSVLLTKGWVEYLTKVDASAFSSDTKDALKDSTKKAEIVADLLSGWDIGKARKYIEETLQIRNPDGFSPAALHARATLPESVSTMLDATKLPIDASTLIALSQAETLFEGATTKLSAKVIQKIVDWSITTDASGNKILRNQGILEECLVFLLFKDATVSGAETAQREAKEKVGVWLKDTQVFKHQGDAYYLVNEDALKTKIAGLPDPSAETKKIYDVLHERPNIAWKDLVMMHAHEGWKLAKFGAGVWAEYIAALPRIFWDPEHDADLLKLLNQQAALNKGKDSLNGLLKTSSGAAQFLETTEKGLQARRDAQLKALRGEPAVSPLEHHEQAQALLLANVHVIGQLNIFSWSTCSKRLRQLTLWMSTYNGTKKDPEAGLKEAKRLLQVAGRLTTPEAQDTFVDEQMAKMNATDKQSFQTFIDARATIEVQGGRDILAPYRQRGLNKKPDALELLRQVKDPANPALNLAANVGRWTMDPPEKVRASLEIALEDGPAKAAFINAFVLGKDPATGKDPTYAYQGRIEVVSVIDARLAVNAIQQRLLFEMGGNVKAREQIEDENEFTNPVDRWLRTGIESMKDLWKTDMVGKAEVIAIVFAAYWMIKEAWKSKKGKFALLGLPILLGANAIYKQRTGRDLLGENLRWKNKEDRSSPMEAFRRRGAALDSRYKILLQPSGQAAVRALMNEKNPVKVQDLLDWRNAVKSGGGKKFSTGKPASLQITDIEDNLGAAGSNEKACEVAYLAFEALCVDVARLNGLTGGSTALNAEQGADLIQRRYVMNRSTSLKPASMFDVIMSECQMPTKEMLENKSYLEAAADLFGYTYDEAKALVEKYGVQAWVMMKQGVHKAPEIAAAAKDWAWDTGGAIHDWARLTYAKLKPEVVEDFAASWKFVVETGKAIGMTVITKGPGVVEFVFDGTVNIAGRTLTELKGIYDYMLTVPLLHEYMKPFIESVGRVFGHRFEELDVEKSKQQYAVEEQALVSMFDGGNYPIRDVLAPDATISAFERARIKRTDRLTFVKPNPVAGGPDIPLTDAEVTASLNTWKFSIAKELFGGAGDAAAFEAFKPSQKRYVLEILQANLFREIGKNPALQAAIQKFENDRSIAEGALQGAKTVLDQRKTDRDTDSAEYQRLVSKEREYDRLKTQLTQLLNHPAVPGTLAFAKWTQDCNEKRALMQQIDLELGTAPGRVHLNAAKNKADNSANMYTQAKLDVETKQRALNELITRGVDPVNIKFAGLLAVPVAVGAAPANAIDVKILNAAGIHNRRTELLQNVAIGDSKIFFVPFNWLMGDAEYRAFQVSAVEWKTQRMKNDALYQQFIKENKDPKACAAYERYLENVLMGEVFLRSMLTSYAPADGEQQRPLHFSVHEARMLNQYLEERERLMTFKQFMEVWSSVPDAERDQKLP